MAGIVVHVFWTLLCVMSVAACLWRFGKRPRGARIVFFGLLGGLGFLCVFAPVIVVGVREGTRSDSHFVLMFVGASLLLIFLESKRLAVALCVGLFVWMVALRLEYMTLAQTREYTDSPQDRMQFIAEINTARMENKLKPVRDVKISPAPHTWLTHLYEVNPPFGDYLDYEEARGTNEPA